MNKLASLEQLKDLLPSGEKRRLALVASNDAHCLEAIAKAKKHGLVEPVLIGPRAETEEILRNLGENPAEYEFHDVNGGEECAMLASKMANERSIDGIMKGHLQTAELMHVMVNRDHGIRTSSVISGVALFEIPGRDKPVLISDIAMVMAPTLEQKKAIVENAVRVMHRLGVETPKVAVLSAAEKPSPQMPGSMDATALKQMNERGELSGCIVEGPISFDLAMSAESAEIKGYQGNVRGDADILIMPDISAGNILVKCLAVAAKSRNGGILVGTKVPVVVLSRAATAEDKYDSILLSVAVGQLE